MRSSSKTSKSTIKYKYMVCFRYGAGKSVEIDLEKNDLLRMMESRYLDLQLDEKGFTRFYITDASYDCLNAAFKAVSIKKMFIVLSSLLAVHEAHRNQAIFEENGKRVLAITLTPQKVAEVTAYCAARARMSAYFIGVDAASSAMLFDLGLIEKCKTKELEEFSQAINEFCEQAVTTACVMNVDKPKGPSALSSFLNSLYPGRIEVRDVTPLPEQKVISAEESPSDEGQVLSYPVRPQRTAMSLSFFSHPEIYNEMPVLEMSTPLTKY